MEVVFIKDHPIGIPKGKKVHVNEIDAARWLEEGYVEEVKSPLKNLVKKVSEKKSGSKKK